MMDISGVDLVAIYQSVRNTDTGIGGESRRTNRGVTGNISWDESDIRHACVVIDDLVAAQSIANVMRVNRAMGGSWISPIVTRLYSWKMSGRKRETRQRITLPGEVESYLEDACNKVFRDADWAEKQQGAWENDATTWGELVRIW